MKLVKKTAEYSIFKRGDERYAVTGANKKPINGDEKVKILVAEGLITVKAPAEPEPEAVAEEAAEDVAEAEEAPEAAAEEPAADEDSKED
jgi:hypothetical protein